MKAIEYAGTLEKFPEKLPLVPQDTKGCSEIQEILITNPEISLSQNISLVLLTMIYVILLL